VLPKVFDESLEIYAIRNPHQREPSPIMPTPSTEYPRLSYSTVADSLPPLVARAALHSSKQAPSNTNKKTLVVLDDDPTGTQTVHDIMVLTTFDKEVLREQLRKREPGFFILTNSRAYAHAEVCQCFLRISTFPFLSNTTSDRPRNCSARF
jgi:hypothetical protein